MGLEHCCTRQRLYNDCLFILVLVVCYHSAVSGSGIAYSDWQEASNDIGDPCINEDSCPYPGYCDDSRQLTDFDRCGCPPCAPFENPGPKCLGYVNVLDSCFEDEQCPETTTCHPVLYICVCIDPLLVEVRGGDPICDIPAYPGEACVSDDQCVDDGSTCDVNNLCTCGTGVMQNPSGGLPYCAQPASLLEPCPYSWQCDPAYAYCSSAADGDTCQCLNPSDIPNPPGPNYCLPLVNVLDSCELDEQCPLNSLCEDDGLCHCTANPAYPHEVPGGTPQCDSDSDIGGLCVLTAQCPPGISECSENGICECTDPETPYENPGGDPECLGHVHVQDPCVLTEQCPLNSQCDFVTATCRCTVSTEYSHEVPLGNPECDKCSDIGLPCQIDAQCPVDISACRFSLSGDKICECTDPLTPYENPNGQPKCLGNVGVGEDCQLEEQCPVTSSCVFGTCTCDADSHEPNRCEGELPPCKQHAQEGQQCHRDCDCDYASMCEINVPGGPTSGICVNEDRFLCVQDQNNNFEEFGNSFPIRNDFSGNTATHCRELCGENGFPYAAVGQQGNGNNLYEVCHCGSQTNHLVVVGSGSCERECTGTAQEYCGSNSQFALYWSIFP